MYKLLKLHPHQHTGKVLHHRHTSYRALLLVLVVTGAFMVGLNHLAQAADFTVTGIVPAPLPSEAASITHPASGTTFSTPEISIGGTCPVITPAIIIVLYENSTPLGSQTCSISGTFDIPVSFTVGTHSVVATVMNFTGQTGATSPAISLTYLFPTTGTTTGNSPGSAGTNLPQQSSTKPTSPSGSAAPLEILGNSAFIVFGPSQDAIWNGSFRGGTKPYTVTIWWGDGTVQKLQVSTEDAQAIRHTYAQMKTYSVKIRLNDAAGHTTSRTLTATTPSIFSTYPTQSEEATHQPTITLWMYILYIWLVLLLIAAWRYEHERSRRQLAYVPATKRRPAPSKKRR